MSTEQPDPIGDRMDRILTGLEELQTHLRDARNPDINFVAHIQDNGLEVSYIQFLVESLAKIVRQQHELMVILEHRWAGNR